MIRFHFQPSNSSKYFSICSVAKSCLNVPSHGLQHSWLLCPLLPLFLAFVQIHVHWVSDASQPSHFCCALLTFCLRSFPASGSFPVSRLFALGDQSTGASTSVFPVNIQGWFPLVLTDLISLQSTGESQKCLPRHHSSNSLVLSLLHGVKEV